MFYFSWKRSGAFARKKMCVPVCLLRKGLFEDYSEDNAREALNLSAEEKECLSCVFLQYHVKLLLLSVLTFLFPILMLTGQYS